MMEPLFYVLTGLLVLSGFIYIMIMLLLCIGWVSLPAQANPAAGVKLSVIIAARNEEEMIGNCLDALLSQGYPAELTEIIVVDDHSNDRTAEKVRARIAKHPQLRLLTLNDTEGTGKKAAIAKGVAAASGELILTTDADCSMGKHWLETVAGYYSQGRVEMIVSPVLFRNDKGLSAKLQSLEMLALMGSTGGALYYGKAILCNGANLAYSKKAFISVEGFKDISDSPSGDDVLLMYKIAKQYPGRIGFLKDREAVVYTEPKQSLAEFIEQRKRWASKGFRAINVETRWVSLSVFVFSFLLLFLVPAGLIGLRNSGFHPLFLQISLILVGIKCFIDFLLLFLAASFFKRKKLLFCFLPGQFIYIIYVVVVGMLGTRGKYEWKGRKFN